MMNPLNSLVTAFRRYRSLKVMPLRLEFVVTDWCNLNCRGCTHYSPLAPKEFEPLDVLERNMSALSRACGNQIESAYLIGGETLLYPDLPEAMRLQRRYFRDARLYIFTNGLALPRMSEEFWTACRDTDTVVALTRYPIKFDYDAAEALCASHGVRCEVFGDRSDDGSFFRFALDPHGRQNARMSHFKCYNRGCVSVTGDRVYPCSISACVGHLNRAHGTSFEHRDGDFIAVADVRSADDIRRLRDRPVPFCRYCICPPATVPYGPSKRDRAEWVED